MPLHGKKGLGKKDKKSDTVTRFWYTLKNLHLNGCWVTQAIGPPSYYPNTLAFIIHMRILLELNKRVIVEKLCHNPNLHIFKHQDCKYIIYS